MSVLIKGMEMPKCCMDCPLNYDLMSCSVTGTGWWSDSMMLMDFDSAKERLYNCPLIEIPTPHGRLIDADATCNDLATVDPRYETMIDWCIRVIEAQQTVIEAED